MVGAALALRASAALKYVASAALVPSWFHVWKARQAGMYVLHAACVLHVSLFQGFDC